MRKQKNAQLDGNQLGAKEKGADEGSAITGYHAGLKKSRRGGKAPPVRVVHPDHGEVVVAGGSKLMAIKAAGVIWGKKVNEISRECEVWRIEGRVGCVEDIYGAAAGDHGDPRQDKPGYGGCRRHGPEDGRQDAD